jgi:hypothetical protein
MARASEKHPTRPRPAGTRARVLAMAGMTLAAATAVTAAATAAATAVALSVRPASAQAPRDLTHRATFHESFGFLQTVRELSDGRLLVADPLGGVFARLDLATGGMEAVGREGGGPGEWRQPDAVFPLPDDSTLLVDLGNARLSVLDPAGRFVDSYPIAMPRPAEDAAAGDAPGAGRSAGAGRGPGAAGGRGGFGGPGGLEFLQPRATDAAGRIYYQRRGGMVGPGAQAGAPDSLEVRRWDRTDDAPVRLAGLRPPALVSAPSGGAGNMAVRMRPIPLAPQDDWAVAPDGRVALIRAEPYRVEWLHPDGRVVRGPAMDYTPVRVRTAEKERWVEAMASSSLSVMMTVDGGSTNMQMRRGGARPGVGQGDIDEYEWPDVLPAFRSGGAIIDPNGRVWVERYGQAGSPVLYDVFDRRAHRMGIVRFPAHHRVVGFGRQAVYAVRVDDLGLHWLEIFDPPR